jgi:hypothetical protein
MVVMAAAEEHDGQEAGMPKNAKASSRCSMVRSQVGEFGLSDSDEYMNTDTEVKDF